MKRSHGLSSLWCFIKIEQNHKTDITLNKAPESILRNFLKKRYANFIDAYSTCNAMDTFVSVLMADLQFMPHTMIREIHLRDTQ